MNRNGSSKKKTILCLLLTFVLAIGCFGCGSKGETVSVEDAQSTVVMTIDGYEITLSEYTIFLMQYIGMQGLDPDSLTEEQVASVRSAVASEIKLEIVEYLLAQQMDEIALSDEDEEEIDTNVENYMNQFGEEFLLSYGVDEAAVKQLFTEQAYITKLTDKTKQDLAEENYDDNMEQFKDIKFHTVYYALFPSVEYKDGEVVTDDDGNQVVLSDEDMKEQKKKAEELQKRAKDGEKLEDLIEEYGIEASSGEQHGYAGSYSEELNTLIEDLEQDDISDVVETDAGYMVVRMDNPDDTDYKDYALKYAGVEYAKNNITTVQQGWVSAAGCDTIQPDEDVVNKIDVIELCKQMKKNGIYE